MGPRIRSPRLSLEDLGFEALAEGKAAVPGNPTIPESDDRIISLVREAVEDGYGGVILRGPPGTSKSWYARKIATDVSAGSVTASAFVQFHPSYQYEDFIEGWVSTKNGGFELQPKVFMRLCADAERNPDQLHILVVDEISRSDAARVFGEALTYLEPTKRGVTFQLASGTTMMVPPNLIVLGTMNPWDRGVDALDVALLRRFAQIDMQPDADLLRAFLEQNEIPRALIDGTVRFFDSLLRSKNPMFHIGHAYFSHVKSVDSLLRVWPFQLEHHFRGICRLDPDEFKRVQNMWYSLVHAAADEPTEEMEAAEADEEQRARELASDSSASMI